MSSYDLWRKFMGIYEPMTHYLLRTRADHVRLTFKEIEAIIDRALPGSAYRHRDMVG